VGGSTAPTPTHLAMKAMRKHKCLRGAVLYRLRRIAGKQSERDAVRP